MYPQGGLATTSCDSPVGPRRITITERLTEEKDRLNNRLKEINNALKILEEKPEIAEVVNTISRIY